MGVSVAEKVANGIDKRPLDVENVLCSRFRTTKSDCRLCVERCPVEGALLLSGKGAEITEKCVGCGVCFSACPNGVFRVKEGDDGELADRFSRIVAQRPRKLLSIACSRADANADATVMCLGRLTEGLLLEIFQQGVERIEVLEPVCEGCPLQKAALQKVAVFAVTEALCWATGIAQGRLARTKVPHRRLSLEAMSLSSPTKSLSRRGFFQILRGETLSAVLPDASSSPFDGKTEGEDFREKIRRHPVNEKRRRLLEVLEKFDTLLPHEISTKGTSYAEIEIDSRCMGCNVCETLCPVGAIRRCGTEGNFALDYRPDLCTNCQVCKTACLPNAVRIKETFDLSLLKRREPMGLIRAARRTCRACRGFFLGTGTDFCPLCLTRERRQKIMAHKWMQEGNGNDGNHPRIRC